MLLRIVAPHFVVGVVLDAHGYVVRSPPIVRYMRGWHSSRIVGYCARKGWEVQRVGLL